MNMVERVARVIADANMEDFEETPALHMELARAAIAAMREPTTAMQNAGWREIDAQRFATEDTEVAPIYRAMIDAALTSSEK